MIKIDNLTKVYKSKKKNNCKALDNVTLTLPNNGLVFVLGKSGSGKSTLLNLIGGLDNITSGTITVDGNNISNFKEKEYCDYRNNHIGFIFQDYHLIDELTVYDNIVLSLNLRRIEDKEDVLNALKKVDLQGYENRYPTELSGGERQRVAIARAIVKKPRIILADEPTGNLDTNTATAIIQILKELSKECLILIVSHNIIDANKYADRIIELSKGKKINDKSKNPNYNDNVVYDNNTLYYPYDKVLDVNDITVINENISNSNKMVIVEDKFISTNIEKVNEDKIIIEKKKLKLNKELKLSLKFLKNKIFNISLSSFMVSAIMIILALAQTIINFDSEKIIESEMSKLNQSSFAIEKHIENDGLKCLKPITADDIDIFDEAGYNGDIYPIYNFAVPIFTYTTSNSKVVSFFNKSHFINSTFGTLIVDESFFEDKIGEVKYKCLADIQDPCGLFITDYVADAILATNTKFVGQDKTYEDILGKYTYSSFTNTFSYINGIIITDYKEKYSNLINTILETKLNDISDIYNLTDGSEFLADIYSYLGYSYSYNKNLLMDLKQTKTIEFSWSNTVFFNNNIEYIGGSGHWVIKAPDSYHLNENEGVMDINKYNELFETNYTGSNLSTFKPHKVKISTYLYSDFENENVLIGEEVTIKKLESMSALMSVSENMLHKFIESSIHQYGLYFDGGNIGVPAKIAEEDGYVFKLMFIEGIGTMTKAVDVFIPIFELIAIVLCVGIVLILVSFSSKMIKDKMHEIGILKALGTQNASITSVFGLQILLIALLTIVMSTLGYFFFIDLANDVLIESLKQLAPSQVVLDLDFLTFKIDIALTNMLLILALALVSLLIPMLKIKGIKPVKIIKAKE